MLAAAALLAGFIVFVDSDLREGIYAEPEVPSEAEMPARELIENGDFANEPFSPYVWQKLSNAVGNNLQVTNAALEFGIVREKEIGYHLIAQPMELKAGKRYLVEIDFLADRETVGGLTVEAGFLERGIPSQELFARPLDFGSGTGVFREEYLPQKNFSQSRFFLKASGKPGIVGIKRVSVVETAALAAAPQTEPTPPAAEATAMPQSEPTATAEALASPTATPATAENAEPIELAIAPRWSFGGFPFSVDTREFTQKGIRVFRARGSEWEIANGDKNFTTDPQDGLYFFNRRENKVEAQARSLGTGAPSRSNCKNGWNLLYSASEKAAGAESITVLTSSGEAALAELLEQKKASSTFYYLKQTSSGVALVNADFASDNIPPQTPFWLYLH